MQINNSQMPFGDLAASSPPPLLPRDRGFRAGVACAGPDCINFRPTYRFVERRSLANAMQRSIQPCCPSVCLSHVRIVTKQIKPRSLGLHHR